jgi:tetratricopeptide (TPR) repeat protein
MMRSLGWIWLRLSPPKTAIQKIRQARAALPDDPQLAVYEVTALLNAGEEAEARSLLSQFVQRHPEAGTAQLFKAYFLAVDGKRDEAVAACKLAQGLPPADGEAHAFEGWVRAHSGEVELAGGCFARAAAIRPTANALAGSAWVALTQGHREAAAAQTRQALAIDGTDAQAWWMSAELARLDGRLDDAREALAKSRRYGGPRAWEEELSPALEALAADAGR